jgi:ribosomal protein S18 acetylase RimI-like enzyme
MDRFPHEGYVNWIGTHPEHTRRGLGAYLMYRLLEDFIDRGFSSTVLETDHRLPAIRTYLKMGFILVYEVAEEDYRTRWRAMFQALFSVVTGGSGRGKPT